MIRGGNDGTRDRREEGTAQQYNYASSKIKNMADAAYF
jgi:hypothetical protein